jgi:hypothetical protein
MNDQTSQIRLILVLLTAMTLPGGLGAEEPDASAGTEAPAESESDSKPDEPSVDERLDALLAETLSEDEYRESRRCLSRHEYRSVEILNQQYLLFKRGSTFWVNKLRNRCISLRRDLVLTFNPRGTSNTCDGDIFYMTNRFDLDRGFTATGVPIASQGSCILGTFEEIGPEQAVLLREVRQ